MSTPRKRSPKSKPLSQIIDNTGCPIEVREGVHEMILIKQKHAAKGDLIIVDLDSAKHLANAIFDAAETIYRRGART